MSVVVVSSANNNFGLDLLGNIMDGSVLVSKYCPMLVFMIYCVRTQENVLLSPYSASLALLMAATGARGETRRHNFVEYQKAGREGKISTLPAQAVTVSILCTLAAPGC